jgi:uncharacterized surface protein with fasciclin (FAS1) repeats
MNISNLISGNSNLSNLLSSLRSTGLFDTLSGTGPFTVFAPVNSAFGETIRSLLTNPANAREILMYHVVPGRYQIADLVRLSGQNLQTSAGIPIAITTPNGSLVLNGNVAVTQSDISAGNGVIHLINGVLLPPNLATVTPTPTPSGTSWAWLWWLLLLILLIIIFVAIINASQRHPVY